MLFEDHGIKSGPCRTFVFKYINNYYFIAQIKQAMRFRPSLHQYYADTWYWQNITFILTKKKKHEYLIEHEHKTPILYTSSSLSPVKNHCQMCVCVCVFGFNVAFDNFSVISRRCLVARGSSVLTFIVLPHRSIMPRTLDMIPHPVTLSWHWVDQS